MKRLKISREGIVLIKSFEGFRPRAVPRQDGGWVIGYGHTLSAREGASVSEADAELLLQYDLLPVVQAVNEGVEGRVNQHQFDALASFVFSVGVDPFNTSDVLERIRAGFSNEAADAMVGWPEPALPEAALRRRAAERALFVADPAAPVALADLLAAPLPPPPVPAAPMTEAAVADTGFETPAAAPSADDVSADVEAAQGLPDARSAALAHLLDTPDVRLDGPEIVAAEGGDTDVAPEPTTDDDRIPAPEFPAATEAADVVHDPAPKAADSSVAPDQKPTVAEPEPEPAERPVSPIVFASVSAHRYSPYGRPLVGPLPSISGAAAPEPQPADTLAPAEELPVPAESPVAPAEADAPATIAPSVPDQPDTATAPPADQPTTELATTELPTAELGGLVEPLTLTPLAEGGFTATSRLVWPENSREGEDVDQSPLFDEDAVLHRTLGPVVRPDMIEDAAGRFSWGETGAYLVMGGFGLVSFGMGMAAFRLASQQSSGAGETAMMGGVLTLIAIACVGVSTYNLYRRWGRSDED